MGFPGGSAGKESACNAGDLGLFPGLGRSPGEGNGYPLQYFGLENSMDCIVHGVTKGRTRLSDFTSLDCMGFLGGSGVIPGGSEGKVSATVRETQVRTLDWEDPLEKEMATHSSTLAWKILWMEEPGGLQSMGSQRVGHN